MFVLCLYRERICFVKGPRSRDRISIFVFYVHAYNDEAKLGEHTNEHSIADWPFTFVTMYASARSFHGFSMKLESSFSATRERSQKNIVIDKKIGLVNLKFKFLLCLHHERCWWCSIIEWIPFKQAFLFFKIFLMIGGCVGVCNYPKEIRLWSVFGRKANFFNLSHRKAIPFRSFASTIRILHKRPIGDGFWKPRGLFSIVFLVTFHVCTKQPCIFRMVLWVCMLLS